MILCSIECYELCQGLMKEGGASEKGRVLKARLGNAWNELGVFYKQLSSTMDFNKGLL